jgi:hypothetical protein
MDSNDPNFIRRTAELREEIGPKITHTRAVNGTRAGPGVAAREAGRAAAQLQREEGGVGISSGGTEWSERQARAADANEKARPRRRALQLSSTLRRMAFRAKDNEARLANRQALFDEGWCHHDCCAGLIDLAVETFGDSQEEAMAFTHRLLVTVVPKSERQVLLVSTDWSGYLTICTWLCAKCKGFILPDAIMADASETAATESEIWVDQRKHTVFESLSTYGLSFSGEL